MWRGVLWACLPWFGLMTTASVVLLLGSWACKGRWQLAKIGRLFHDQSGTVQSLSFVLTLPFLVLVILFIVQVAQLMVATIVVHYAAFAAARAAAVWIPARVESSGELENRISFRWVDPTRWDQEFPALDPDDPNFGPSSGGIWYEVEPGSPKFMKIASAAVLACAAISPSSRLPLPPWPPSAAISPEVIDRIYHAMVPDAILNARVPERLRNKLDYATRATEIRIAFFHPNLEPPLISWGEPPDPNQFYWDELGWQDPIVVTVRYRVPLMPALGRILARPLAMAGGQDPVSGRIEKWGGIYVYPISATVMLGNEGDMPVYPYPEVLW